MSTNVASVTNHFPKPQPGFTTTTSGPVSSGATTVGLNSTGDYSNGDIVVLVIDPTDANKKQVLVGTVDTGGVQLTGVVWTDGTNQAHAAGATVVDYVSATHIQMMAKGILVHANQDGTLKDNAVHSAGVLANNVVTTAKLADSSVTPQKMLGIDVYALSSVLAGSAPTAGTGQFYIQCGTNVPTLSSNVAAITFPTAFPGGVVTVVAMEGDNTTNGIKNVESASASGFSVRSTTGSGLVRVNWIAIGF